jgi:chromatin remodeling complex protein RSC6
MPSKSAKVNKTGKKVKKSSTNVEESLEIVLSPTEKVEEPTEKVEDHETDSVEHNSSGDDSETDSNQWDSLELHEKTDYIFNEIKSFKQALQNLLPKITDLRKCCKSAKIKGKKKKKQSDEKKQNHGVMKVVDVPNDVTTFLGLESSVQVSRRDLLTGVCNYIRDTNLQNPDAKKEFTLDDKLKTVLCKRKNKETKEYENITEDKLVYTQLMGAITYWFDQKVDHNTAEVAEV